MKKVILLLICFYGVYANAQPFMLDQVVGVVGNKPVKQSDVESNYTHLRGQGVPVRGDMKCGIFEELMTQKLLMNQAEVDSLIVEPSEVELDLNRRLDHYIMQIGSQENLEDFFKQSIYDIKDDLRKNIFNQKMADKMQYEITKNVKITPSEVRSFYNRIHRDSIPLINGQARVAQIVVYPPYSEEAISDVRQSLLDIRKRVVEGANFRTQAVLHSECESAIDGGELGFRNRGELDPEFAKAAWALKNAGDISRIVESKNGFHLIQLVDKRGDMVSVRHILMTPKINPEAATTATTRLDSIVQAIRLEKINWNTAALYFSQDENTRFNGGLMINPYTHGTFFDMDQLERVEFTTIEKMNIGEISEPYLSRDDKNRQVYKVIKLVNRTDPRRATLKDDYNFLSEMALTEKMHKVIKEWVDEKLETSYIYVDDSFKRCLLSNNWLKQ